MSRFQYLTAFILIMILVSIGISALGSDNQTAQQEKEFNKFLNDNDRPQIIAFIQMVLWREGYYGPPSFTGKIDKDTQKAIQGYQKHRGLPVNGILDAKTFEKIMSDTELIQPDPVGVEGFAFSDSFWNTYFAASGTWVFENSDEKMANPVQTTEIECHRNMGVCIEATADIAFDHGLLDLTMELFEVERWDKFEIVTKPYDYQCTRYVLRINKQQRSVKKLRTTLRTKDMCKSLDADDKYIRLVNGFDEWWEFKSEMHKKRNKISSPSFKKSLEKFVITN